MDKQSELETLKNKLIEMISINNDMRMLQAIEMHIVCISKTLK